MRHPLFLLGGLLFCLAACQAPSGREALIGAWKVDSTYSYYNGFSYSQVEEGSDWATYVYEADGVMKEIKYGSFQSYFFDFPGPDSLRIRATTGGEPIHFEVLELNDDRLVLKKHKAPIFGGNKQERYEIRFFSRTEPPKEDAIPFQDPRR